MIITVKFKCGCYRMVNAENVKTESQIAQLEVKALSLYCADCKERIQEHNDKPKNTRLHIPE